MSSPGKTPEEWLSYHRLLIQDMLRAYGGSWSDLEELARESETYDAFCDAFGEYFAELIWNRASGNTSSLN